MSFSAIYQFNNLNGLGPSILSSIRIQDCIVVLLSITQLVALARFKSLVQTHFKQIKKVFVYTFSILLLLIVVDNSRYYLRYKSLSGKYEMFFYDQCTGCKNFGLVTCWNWQFISVLEFRKTDSEKSELQIQNWLKNHRENNKLYFLDGNSEKNILFILVESLEGWVINTTVNGKEITPNLNKIIRSEQVIYTPYVKPRTRDGRSSDAQFTINTGILPLNVGAVCYLFPHNRFYSLADALNTKKGYSCESFIGDEASFWNQSLMTETLGFDRLHSSIDFDMSDKVGMGLSDDSFFQQLPNKLRNLQQPFYAQCITLSSHLPFEMPRHKVSIQLPDTLPEVFVKYAESIHYADFSIGILLDSLNAMGLLDNTILLISGDHEALTIDQRLKIRKHPYSKQIVPEGFFVPLIISNADTSKYVTDTITQADIYPTMMSVMGLNDYNWMGVGTSMFNVQVDSNGLIIEDIVDTKDSTYIYNNLQADKVSDYLIRTNYFERWSE